MASPVQTRTALPRLRRSESLANILSQGGPLPEEQIWSLLDQLLRFLEQQHHHGRCHRTFSLTTIGFDDAGELEIASTDAALSISDLVRLHAPLPGALRHEFELRVPATMGDAAVALSHAGFEGDGESLDLFQVAVLLIRLVFDVNCEKFLTSPCLQEALPAPLAGYLCAILTADRRAPVTAKGLRELLPGADAVAPPTAEAPPADSEVSAAVAPQSVTSVAPVVADLGQPAVEVDAPVVAEIPAEAATAAESVACEVQPPLPLAADVGPAHRSIPIFAGVVILAVAVLGTVVVIALANLAR